MAAPTKSAEYEFVWGPSPVSPGGPPPAARVATYFSPPLIAMVAVVGTAFLIVLYARILSRHLRRFRRSWRRWRRRRRLLQSTAAASSGFGSPPPGGGGVSFGSYSDYFLSPYGLDDSAIKTLPLSFFSKARAKQLANRDCAVCLLEFEDDDSLRTLPLCAHAFHVDCIDVWLRSHATCPLCRAVVFRLDSPFVPMRAARIRPSIDDDLLLLDPLPEAAPVSPELDPEIAPGSPAPRRDFLLKRSYSFGFERSLAAERLLLEASTASPWRYRHRSFWSKRWPSPFAGSSSASRASRVFSFRSYRGVVGGPVKSPFFRRRGLGFFPLSSEPSVRASSAGPSWSRRSRSMASPSAIFMRGPASSSRMRCGDPEALLSPERLNRR